MSATYTLKFFKGRKLIVEHAFEVDGEIHDIDSFKQETAYDSGAMIIEAIDCNPPEPEGAQS